MITKENLVQTNPKRYNHKAQNFDNKPKIANSNTFEKKGTRYFYGKLSHHVPRNSGNSPKANISQANLVTDYKNWMVDSSATRHIYANRDVCTSYTPIGDEEKVVYLGDSHTTQVLGKGKVV